jgi:hypothetical protein
MQPVGIALILVNPQCHLPAAIFAFLSRRTGLRLEGRDRIENEQQKCGAGANARDPKRRNEGAFGASVAALFDADQR